MSFRNNDDQKAYWKENLALLFKLLVVWFAVSFGAGILFADALNNIQFFGFKLGFWFAQQGSILVFVALIFVYMAKMSAMDKRYGVEED
jgi:putative solute:sodium symporter small subunit